MKDVRNIIGSISKTPEFKKINTNRIIDEVIAALPPVIKKGVEFAYIKHSTLFFVLSHPIYKSEFKFRDSHIKHLIKSSPLRDIQKIECFVTNKPKPKEIKSNEEKISFYEESSHGIFENCVEDEILYNKFEEIRKAILKNKTINED
jgi:hypothetical protein